MDLTSGCDQFLNTILSDLIRPRLEYCSGGQTPKRGLSRKGPAASVDARRVIQLRSAPCLGAAGIEVAYVRMDGGVLKAIAIPVAPEPDPMKNRACDMARN